MSANIEDIRRRNEDYDEDHAQCHADIAALLAEIDRRDRSLVAATWQRDRSLVAATWRAAAALIQLRIEDITRAYVGVSPAMMEMGKIRIEMLTEIHREVCRREASRVDLGANKEKMEKIDALLDASNCGRLTFAGGDPHSVVATLIIDGHIFMTEGSNFGAAIDALARFYDQRSKEKETVDHDHSPT